MAVKQLSRGDKAPQFSVTDVDGKTVSIVSKESAYTFAVFLRYAGCPWCSLTVNQLVKQHKAFTDRNCRIICFIQSDAETIKKSVLDRQENGVPFHVVADPAMHYYAAYGIEPTKLSIFHQIAHSASWLRSVVGMKNKPKKPVDANLFLIPGAFLIESASQEIKYRTYSASYYSEKDFEIVLKHCS